jgi:hypothetical protein
MQSLTRSSWVVTTCPKFVLCCTPYMYTCIIHATMRELPSPFIHLTTYICPSFLVLTQEKKAPVAMGVRYAGVVCFIWTSYGWMALWVFNSCCCGGCRFSTGCRPSCTDRNAAGGDLQNSAQARLGVSDRLKAESLKRHSFMCLYSWNSHLH